jgi:hypothetical protein
MPKGFRRYVPGFTRGYIPKLTCRYSQLWWVKSSNPLIAIYPFLCYYGMLFVADGSVRLLNRAMLTRVVLADVYLTVDGDG